MIARRLRLIFEEVAELCEAIMDNDVAEVADALVDIEYVVVGSSVEFGLPHDRIWQAVHAANMGKFPECTACHGRGLIKLHPFENTCVCHVCEGKGRRLLRDAAGKVMKPEGWKPADIRALLGV